MDKNISNTIKGRIAECIAEELFKELEFFVIKYGQEHQVEPITQLERFINIHNGNFKLKYGGFNNFNSFNYVRKMPDFFIVKNNFPPELLEVKYRSKGVYENAEGVKDNSIIDLFEYYPTAILLIIVNKSNVNFNNYTFENGASIEGLKNTNFQICFNEEELDKKNLNFMSLSHWLKEEFNISENFSTSILEKYENLVDDWLNK